MKHIESISIRGFDSDIFPFSLPLFKKSFTVELDKSIAIIAGDNGSGKSTLLEAIAYKLSLPAISSHSIITDDTFEPARKLFDNISIRWRNKTPHGLFFRAEDYIGFVRSISSMKSEMQKEIEEMKEYIQGEGFVRAKSVLQKQINELETKYKGKLEHKSHGEGFLEIFNSRIQQNGVYVFDEPEASLSPLKQLSLISLIMQANKNTDAQFIIATHSPIIMGIPDAAIYYITEQGVQQMLYEETEHYTIYKSFLDNKERFLRYL